MEPDLIPASMKKENFEDFDFGPKFKRLEATENVRELQTVLRDKTTNRSDFVFYADRLIRLVVEEGLNQLPYRECEITTPTGNKYNGLVYEKGNCCVSIMRSGEAMEQGLRDCCRSIRIGKILIHSDEDTHDAKVVYSKLPPDIASRKVLLMYPIMSTGNTVIKALNVLKASKVQEKNIILLNLFITPQVKCDNNASLCHAVNTEDHNGNKTAKAVISKFPELTILTSEVHPVAPNHFGQKYFGTS